MVLEQRGWGPTRPLWGFVLLALRHRSRSISEVGELLGITKQAAAKVIDGLSQAGLARREADPADRRAAALTLTERGERFLRDAESAYEAIETDWADRRRTAADRPSSDRAGRGARRALQRRTARAATRAVDTTFGSSTAAYGP